MTPCRRCRWVAPGDPDMLRYHDHEWCRPHHDERYLFELLLLESFQAGLSWACILHKREAFRAAFDDFDPQKIAEYDAQKCEALAQNAAIVRNRRKISAAVTNARVFLDIAAEWGSFDRYIWHFTDGQTVRRGAGEMPVTSPLSDEVSANLQRRGMRFVGSTIIYSYLQSIGVVNDHEPDCDFA